MSWRSLSYDLSDTAAAEEMLVEGTPTDSAEVPSQRTPAERAAAERAASLRAVFASSPRPGQGPDAPLRVPGEITGSRRVAGVGQSGSDARGVAGRPAGGAGQFGGGASGAGGASGGGLASGGAAGGGAFGGAAGGGASGGAAGGESTRGAAGKVPKRRKRRLWLVPVLIALIAIGGGAAYVVTRGNPFRVGDRVATVDPSAGETVDPRPTATGLAGEPVPSSEPPVAESAPIESAPTAEASATISPSPSLSPSLIGRLNPSKTNLALHKKAESRSDEQPGYSAASAVDGNLTTRWSSGFSDPQWIRVDLAAVWSVTDIKLDWENAYAKSYHVDVSLDAKHWTTVYRTTTGGGGIRDIPISAAPVRYVRMYGTKRNTQYGYSLLEFEVR